MYTGFVYESIIKDAKMSQILPFIDVLVDGPYKDELRDTSLRFRGSSNQRIIELKNGIAQNIS
jgi:anaerobic ribonucleoside-triphosphate reductase activating protein